jgi:biopolymer transport protein ExbB
LENSTYGLIQLFNDGGLMMYFLLVASLLGMGVIIAKAYVLHVARRDTKKVLRGAEGLARQGKIDEAMELAEQTPGPVSAILLAGLKRIHNHRTGGDVEKAMTSTGMIELGFLERGLVILATVATVAPLMGFLGTVWGMIEAFGAIALAGQVEATLVAAGIKIALVTTATGLVIAIPINIAYNYFVTRIDQLIVDMEEGTTAVLNLLWDMKPTAAMAAAAPTGRTRRTAAGATADSASMTKAQPIGFEPQGTVAPDPGAAKGPEHRTVD